MDLPATELQDRGASLSDLWGRQATSNLREQLLAARSPEAKFKILEHTLLQRIDAPLEPTHPAVSFAVENFRQRPTRPVSSVTDQIGLSDRRFIQLFSQQVGLTPKLFCRVQRFQKVLGNITRAAAGSVIDWPQIALTCGHFDQLTSSTTSAPSPALIPQRTSRIKLNSRITLSFSCAKIAL